MAFYAAFLATGHAIALKSIKSGTVKKYLSDIAKFLQNFDTETDRNVCKPKGTITRPIQSITSEMKRFEDMPKRREPWTLQLQSRLDKICEDETPDSLNPCLRNIYGNGLVSGDRRVEILQPSFNRAPEKPQLNNRGEPYAFMKNDIIFFASNRRTVIPHAKAIKSPRSVFYVQKRYHVQKNGDNGATKLHARNTKHPNLCNVTHWLTIVDRFIRLVGESVNDRPLAIYNDDKTGKILNICSNDSKKTMQMVVKLEYGYTEKVDLDRWTNHSLRVGACCILQSQKCPDQVIQDTLRWKSETWKMYCRNLASVAIDLCNTISDEFDQQLLANLII